MYTVDAQVRGQGCYGDCTECVSEDGGLSGSEGPCSGRELGWEGEGIGIVYDDSTHVLQPKAFSPAQPRLHPPPLPPL